MTKIQRFLILSPLIMLVQGMIVPAFSQNIQKPVIDSMAIDKWLSIGTPSINETGEYYGYYIFQKNKPKILNLSSANQHWKTSFPATKHQFYGKQYVFAIDAKKNLHQVRLGTDEHKIIKDVDSYDMVNYAGVDFLIYMDQAESLHFINLKNHSEKQIEHVEKYLISADAKYLYTIEKSASGSLLKKYTSIASEPSVLASAPEFGNLIFMQNGEKFAYTINSGNATGIYIGTSSLKKTIVVPIQIDTAYNLQSLEKFSSDGNTLYINLVEKAIPKSIVNAVNVNIWSSKDFKLQSEQLHELAPNVVLATINLLNNSVQIQQGADEQFSLLNEDLAIVSIRKSFDGERNWNPDARSRHYLQNLHTRDRRLVPVIPRATSPDQKYLIGNDTVWKDNDLFIYNIQTGKRQAITSNLLSGEKETDGRLIDDKRSFQFYAWVKEDGSMLFTDEYDIWQVKLDNPQRPTCITNGFGRSHQIKLRLALNLRQSSDMSYKDLKYLCAFDLKTKQNGFYKLDMKNHGNPEKIFMGDEYIFFDQIGLPFSPPLKAEKTDVWLVTRMRADRTPNLYLTSDFKTFKKVSDLKPEKEYNWLNTELVNFNSQSGRELQGVLYKPENLDTTRKYPVIINFYEYESHKLNVFPGPGYTKDNINIPYFVSRGYLVFTPDIRYVKGNLAKDATDALVGAAKSLSKFKYVDSTKIAIQGHSFGCFQLYTVITRTNRFCAAVGVAGSADLISYGADLLKETGQPTGRVFSEVAQGRIEASFWEAKEKYIENSAVFHLDEVATPLLIVHGRLDEIVDFSQSIEMFTGLRRLGKTVWMLDYEDDAHSITKDRNYKDYTLRLEQFFDHYLKDKPMPIWMKHGVPAKLKGIETGLKLDSADVK